MEKNLKFILFIQIYNELWSYLELGPEVEVTAMDVGRLLHLMLRQLPFCKTCMI